MKSKTAMVAILITAFAAALGCSAPAESPGNDDGPACEAKEHEGLLCWRKDETQQLGVCQQYNCIPLPCEVDDDCNDRQGHDACRTFACQGDGTCFTQAVSEGFQCSHAGGAGVCVAGTCTQ